jgi:hypothetical protein
MEFASDIHLVEVTTDVFVDGEPRSRLGRLPYRATWP